jgi:lauroyl/myristoyl acyltransferase
MVEYSVTDLSVAMGNPQMFELLCRLPAEFVLDFFEKANSWEMRHDLAGRLAGHNEMVRRPLALTPGLSDRGEQLAAECAEYLFRSNATLFALAGQLERAEPAPLTVDWQGTDNLRAATAGGRPAVVFAPHFGFLYAVPLALAVLGQESSVLGNAVARDVLCQVVPSIAPRLWKLVDYILVPSPESARKALAALNAGRHLVIFPEVNMGSTGNLRAATMPFLGRRIWVPTAVARFARMAGADIVPMLVAPGGSRQVTIEVHEPVAGPADRGSDIDVSLRLFEWLERVVLRRPQLWLGWPMLDGIMAVADQG